MFTERFIQKKLKPFILALKAIEGNSYNEGGASDYSRQMVKNLIDIASFLESDPNESALKTKQAEIKQKFQQLDNQTGTYAPAVFNEQSVALANELKRFLSNDVTEEDFDPSLRVALKAVAGSNFLRFLANVVDYIDINILIYTKLVEAQELALDYNAIDIDASEGMEALNQLEKKFAILSIDNRDDIEALRGQYASIASSLLEKASNMPYVRWSFGKEYVNSKLPFKFDPNDLGSSGHRGRLLKTILAIESRINAKLKELSLEPVCQVYNYCIDRANLVQTVNLSDQYIQYVGTIEKQLNIYKEGKHLPLWFKPDAGKVKIFEKLLSKIPKLSDDNKNVGYAIMQTYSFLLAAIQEHQAYILMYPDLSAGKLVEYLAAYTVAIQEMLEQINEASDESFIKFLQSISNEADAGPAPAP